MSKLTFATNVDPVDAFRCNLKCDQCTHIKDDGTRCKNRVCIGYPVCWLHTKKIYGLRVKDSTQIEFEKGLFTEKDIQDGDWICPYVGEILDERCINARYPGDVSVPYAVDYASRAELTGNGFDGMINETVQGFVGRQYVDSACVRGVGSMANGLFRWDGTPRDEGQHNVIIESKADSDDVPWLRANRDIERGEELFVYSGPGFNLEQDHETKRTRRPDNRPC